MIIQKLGGFNMKENKSKKIPKEIRIQKEVQTLNNALASGNLITIISKVAYILNNYKDTRNSDMALKIKYWQEFEGFKGNQITVEEMFKLTRDTSIARARAKIQNEYKLYQADDRIKSFRKDKEDLEKEIQLSNKPGIPNIHLYMDESGKSGSDKYMVIGGLWVLENNRMQSLQTHFREWKSSIIEKAPPKEFHFTEMKKQQLNIYKGFFAELLSIADMISLKAVVVDRTKSRFKSMDKMIYDLYYQHVHQGIEHEEKSGRIILPKVINFWKDKEEGNDNLFMEELRQSLITNFAGYFKDKLTLNSFSSIDSFTSYLIQIADLYTGSISRVLNHPNNGTNNHKDEFAKYVFEILKIDLSDLKNQDKDMAMIHFI